MFVRRLGTKGAGGSGFFSSTGYRTDFYTSSGTPIRWRNPLTGKVEDIPSGTAFHQDHIFPRKAIEDLSGFDNLTVSQQKKLLNDARNLQPLDASMNCSKGCKLEGKGNDWDTYKGQGASPFVKTRMAHTVLPTKIRNRNTSLRLLQNL